jgi:hypothetical protein
LQPANEVAGLGVNAVVVVGHQKPWDRAASPFWLPSFGRVG